MKATENIHKNHRKRITERFIKSPESFAEHELLEVLLYAVIRQKDTNPIAHRLLSTFGSLKSIFNASVHELMTIDGVGESVAMHIKTLGIVCDKIIEDRSSVQTSISTPSEVKEFISKNFIATHVEKCMVLLLDCKYKLLNSISFEDNLATSVNINSSKLAELVAITKPAFAILIHNHTSTVARPSLADDEATLKMHYLFSLHGTRLIDHVIVDKKGNLYSYRDTDRLIEIKKIGPDKLMGN